ncbi:MAG: LemA family protein [Kiritimatiellaeota bacterium]|nr:LemA family protein [Kiritimatiellota bacterium]
MIMPVVAVLSIPVVPIVVLGILVVLVLALVAAYNGLVVLRNRFKNAFAQIDVQLKRRYDLIPNLVETAKGYMAHERETLEAVVKARNVAMGAASTARNDPGDPDAMKGLLGAEGALRGSMARMMVVVERYPELKADKNMAVLMEELTSTENKVAFARQAYNDAVTVYNTKRETFPTVLVAGMMGFKAAQLFEVVDPTEREAVKVQF